MTGPFVTGARGAPILRKMNGPSKLDSMKGRESVLLLFLLLVLLAGGGAFVLFSRPDGGKPSIPQLPGLEETPLPRGTSPSPLEGKDGGPAGKGEGRSQAPRDIPKWGTILGRIQVEAGKDVPGVSRFWIYLEEARNTVTGRPRVLPYTFDFATGGGSFRIPKVPFGPWKITVVVPDMVGDSIVRVLGPDRPVAEVLLTVKKGRELVVNVRDPDRNPQNGVDVLLIPEGPPPGRRTLVARSEGLGIALFRNVLHGKYLVQVGLKWRNLTKPQHIDVGPVEPRVVAIVIRKGGKLSVLVLNEGGFPIEGAFCHLFCLARRFREFKKTTDKQGKADFGRIPPGTYQLRVTKKGYLMGLKTRIEVEEGGDRQVQVNLKFPR